ncbi:MAG: OmpH family outer membrane protein [Flavobacteriaceae bacterium]|nr:OmpH family outer membrane protein [Flavobacteriaceae bacterium]
MKKVLLFTILSIGTISFAQKAQRVGYIDMEYILENIPEYTASQSKLDAKATSWELALQKQQRLIDALKLDFVNEKVLLTNDLIIERQEDIEIKEVELSKLRMAYFGPNGDLFSMRKQLVKPIQDQVYNSIQDIAKKRQYDFIFDKSSDLIMLYSNKKYDISELVLKSIVRTQKVVDAKEKRSKGTKQASAALEAKNAERNTKREALKQKIEAQRAAKQEKRATLKAAIEAKRKKRLEEIEASKKAKEKNTTTKNNNN